MTTTQKGMQKYELKGVVGEGAYGKVFMARNKETGEVGKFFHLFSNRITYPRLLFQLQSRSLKSQTTTKS